MVNLEWYRTFKAIYQYGTLTRAAQELMISQPNVSIQLASLESYIGQQLFIRMPRKMMPTEYGKMLYTQIVESIDNLERVESEFKRTVVNKAPSIQLGTPSEVFNNYLAEHMGSHPDLLLNVEYGLADVLIEKLLNHELDIAIITKKNKQEDSITYEPLFTESFMVVCNPTLDTSEFDKLVIENNVTKIEQWLKKQYWFAYSSDLALIRRFWRENFKKRPILKLQATIPDNDAILKAVANSDRLAITSDLIAGRQLQKGLIKILWKGNSPATNTIYLAYDKNRTQPHYIDKVRTFIKMYIDTVK